MSDSESPSNKRALGKVRALKLAEAKINEIIADCCSRHLIPAQQGGALVIDDSEVEGATEPSPPPSEALAAPPGPLTLPDVVPTTTTPNTGPGHVFFLSLLLGWIGAVIQKNRDVKHDADWLDWMLGNYPRQRARQKACECCEIIAEEGRKAIERAEKVFEPQAIKTTDTAKRKRGSGMSRKN